LKKKFFLLLFFSTLLFGEKLQLLFDGNRHISSSELYLSLDLHQREFYEFYKENPQLELKTIDLVVQTLKDYYKTKGFFHAEVSYFVDRNNITITIEEKSPIIIKDISNNSDLGLNENIPFVVGDIFDSSKFTQSKKNIKHLYAKGGYCNASVDAKAWIDIEQNHAYLQYQSQKNKKCYFGKIDVSPSENIEEEIIRSVLYMQEGSEFSSHSITRSYEELYSYEGISKAIINTEVTKDELVDADVVVVENENPIRFEFGVGASSDEGAMVSMGIMHRNFLGNLKTLSLRGRAAEIKQNVILSFDMPLTKRNFTGFETGFENENFLGFKEYKFFSNLYLKHKREKHVFKESIIFDNINTYESDDEILFPLNQLFVTSAKLEYNYDTRDKILDPSRGHFIKSEIMGSAKGSISDATYYKYRVGGGVINSLNSTTLALKADYGTLKLIEGAIPTSYRFFAGGMHSNRGYGYRKLGPTNDAGDPIGFDSIFEATAEARFKIYGNFKGVVFNDNSFVAQSSGAPDFSSGYHSLGFGIRYMTPIGPIAVDVGFDVDNPKEQYAIHFHVGELF